MVQLTHILDPRVMDAMHRAFNEACAKLPPATTSEHLTRRVALKVLELGRAGIRDADDLTAQTLAFFEPARSPFVPLRGRLSLAAAQPSTRPQRRPEPPKGSLKTQNGR